MIYLLNQEKYINKINRPIYIYIYIYIYKHIHAHTHMPTQTYRNVLAYFQALYQNLQEDTE
jgi:hypothetical protein